MGGGQVPPFFVGKWKWNNPFLWRLFEMATTIMCSGDPRNDTACPNTLSVPDNSSPEAEQVKNKWYRFLNIFKGPEYRCSSCGAKFADYAYDMMSQR